ncbi:MAG: DNA polymerase III subunit beta [Phycisphaeraceae bacterium]|nr:DNA polymerase III subunit beta [Phycisphaeraceae bacterium]
MKVQFNRLALAEALSLLTSVVPSRTPKPILKCVRFEASAECVHIYATDLEVGLNYILSEVQVVEPGEAVLAADRLSAIVRESLDEVLTLEVEDNTCEIKGSDSHFTIYGQEPDQFPNVPDVDGEPDLEVSLQELKRGIKQCLFATAKESSRYAINGVLWEVQDNKMLLVATDGRRLAQTRVNLIKAPETDAITSLIVPSKTMGLVEKLGGDDKEKVSIKLVGSQILLSCSHVVISSNLVEGNFPKYEDIIPKDYDKRIMLGCEAVASAVRRASLLASEETKGIKLSISEDSLMFSGRAPEAGAAEITMGIEYTGEPISVGFNPQFITDALRVIQTPEFELDLGQPDRPGLIRSGSDFQYVLMPINLG